MNLKFKLTIIAVVLLNFTMMAQSSYLLKGTVVSSTDNSPIPGSSIIIKDTTKGTTTDFDGVFALQVKQGDVLQVSFIGFETKLITITNQKNISISLAEAQNVLDEVVVIGYGTSKKSHLTGAISKVVNEDLDQVAVSRVDDALVGQVSGVNIQATEGEAGSAPTIRIRGTGSITGDSSPLVVVDGVVVDADFLGSLDMNDVESFEVLKDAASGAIYGSRGGNGVIMITTKSGKDGETKFNYSTYIGYKSAHQSDAYNLTLEETAAAELAANGVLSDKTIYKQLINAKTNWQDVIFDGGVINNHSFSARGGNEKLKFSTALNYLNDQGVLLTDEYHKYSVKAKVEYKFTDRFSMGLSVTPSHTKRRRFDGSAHDILRQPSWLPVYVNEDNIQYVNRVRDNAKYADVKIGDYATQRMFDDYDLVNGVPVTSGTDISNTSNTNPAAKILERKRMDYKYKVVGSLFAKYKINDDLSFKTTASGDRQYTRQSRYQGVLAHRNGASNSQLDSTNIRSFHLALDNVLMYNKNIGDHDISAVVGASAEKTKYEYETIRGSQFEDDSSQIIASAAEISESTGYEYENTLMSFFGRVNYAYADKYLASFSARRDGSSVFGPDTKYGNFLAGSLGWNVYKEDFLADSDVVSNLKLRVSYGVTGNNSFETTGGDLQDNFPYLALLTTVNTSAVVDGTVTDAVNPLNIANSELGWERSIEFNPGIDFGFYDNVVSGSIDFYTRTSDKLLLDNPVSTTTGFSNALVNIGEVQNRGIEVELRTRNFSRDNFKWTTTLIASKNENELTDFADSNGQIQNVDAKRAAEWINLEGQPISSFYGWVVDRDIPLEYLSNPYHPVGAEAQDVYVKDLNGDGLIDDDDKTIIGNPYPELVWSVTNDFKISNFDVSFMFQGSHGAEVRNMGDQYIFNHFNSAQDFISSTPDQEFIKQKIFTNDIVQDASYIALRNVNIGYNFKESALSNLGITKLRVYASGQNLMYLTADDYTGFNPESIYDTSATTYGYQRAGSPVYSTVSLGVNIDF
ncbi:SusC/RagA family TonB-linked outer membrane protein [Lutibacter oricola]|nr:SusC/RagA family TonB-linked outer membrane protein [Lutibacter oricola]